MPLPWELPLVDPLTETLRRLPRPSYGPAPGAGSEWTPPSAQGLPWAEPAAGAGGLPWATPSSLSPTLPPPQLPEPGPQNPPLELPEEEGLLSKIGGAFDYVDSYLRGVLAGEPGEQVSGQRVLKNWGLIDREDNPLLSLPGAAGFGLETVASIWNVLGGVGALTKRRARGGDGGEVPGRHAGVGGGGAGGDEGGEGAGAGRGGRTRRRRGRARPSSFGPSCAGSAGACARA
ncbi:MAG: hypothetical protein M5U26_03485 [Planctomycetota bacterium]|nr:hypothetical protein [Planctomycetota bacterium]